MTPPPDSPLSPGTSATHTSCSFPTREAIVRLVTAYVAGV